MNVLKYLFPTEKESAKFAVLLLLSRVVFGLLFASHGLEKLLNFSATAPHFPDPIGFGSDVALALSIFGELACGIAFALGFLTRLALLPMIFTMIVAFITVHGGSIHDGELAFLYLVIFVLSWLAGPGSCSVDGLIGRRLFR
ncbi:DoxX family protein [Prevotella dentasini]|uniref:DoxX family protein n=1 Tax=Prevotella dentasini TaxID=589537 RepID=UPI00046A0ED7|nr:DoxX family protein [Prevotella dentasini]